MSFSPDNSIELSPELLVGLTDGEGKWLRTSKSWKSAMGWDEADLQTRGILQLIHQDQKAFLRQILQKPSAPGSWQQTSLRFADKKGALHWIRWSFQWVEGTQQIYWIGTDITEAKHREENAARFHEALEGVREGIWEVDTYGQTLYANPALAKMLEVSRQLLKQRCIYDYLDQENVNIAQSFLDARSEVDQGETELIWQSGTGIPFHSVVTVKQRRDEQGQVIGALLTVNKIVIKQAQDISYQQIISGLGDVMLELDHASRVVKEWRRPTGINFIPSKLDVGTRLYDFIAFDFAQPIEHAIKQALKEKLPISFTYSDKEVNDKRFECRVAPLKNGPHWTQTVLLSVQATSLYAAEQVKTGGESEQMFKLFIDQLPTAVFAKDIRSDLRFTVFNHEAERLLGLKASEVVNRTDYDVFTEEQADYFRAKDNQSVMNPQTVRSDSEFITTPQGQLWVRSQRTVIPDQQGKPRYVIGTLHDVTKMKELAERAHASEQLYSFLSEATQDGLWEWDLLSNRFTCSIRWYEMLGYQVGELEGPVQTWYQTLEASQRERVEEHLKSHIENQEPFAETLRFLHKNGSILTFECRMHTLRSDDGKPLRTVCCLAQKHAPASTPNLAASPDVSDTPQVPTATVIPLRTLSHAIAQQMSEPLQLIKASADQLLRSRIHQKLNTDRYKITAKKIKDAALRLQSLSRGIQALSDPKPAHEQEEFHLKDLLLDVHQLFSETLQAKGIEFTVETEGRGMEVFGQPTRFLEVLVHVMSGLLEKAPTGQTQTLVLQGTSERNQVRFTWSASFSTEFPWAEQFAETFGKERATLSLEDKRVVLILPYDTQVECREANPA